ncbi:DNA gyrase/topoisomerase IV subunit A [Thermoflavifilum thermophilum]|uniref:Topoisomerase-4 subunit A n=1 Tax=Thermoflavifilum thermophilum TaxID=1393122 RepID=A0A1I7NLA1_9BACT|nr:DNA gyrase/topoisomerase IV subunit A [Thermoflavifilum thermophilum]SFV35452.1 topoisomerase-4 subunit A [Thermoflavifilum thermophilum]
MSEEKTFQQNQEETLHNITAVSGLYENWFLDYASYVILERAVPAIEDGLKPVQRRILHAMKEMDDGRFNKVANIIGQSMQYHPHGDASIAEAIVNLGQKNLLIETQGNWGDIRTGDEAAAPRYIEARLSKFALEVAFNPKTTTWQLSYDGRKYEPLTLPMKFPLLLAQGVEGIAVGLSTRILPHNFCEIIDAAIAYLKNKPFQLYPDFPTGDMVDVSQYQDGKRGGRVKVRVHIEEKDKKTLIIRDVPYGITTTQLIDSIIKANDAGKIKIKKVVDNTAKDVEIEIQLAPGVSPEVTIDALYAFTDCEISISPNACVIIDDKPHFVSISDILKYNVNYTRSLLQKELEIKLQELEDEWHFASLEKIFIEKRIYRDIENAESWEEVLETIRNGLQPYLHVLHRPVSDNDIVKLTEIKIKRISKYDLNKAEEDIRQIEQHIEETQYNLNHLTEFTIQYFENLKKKYGKGRERLTEIRVFDTIQATAVAMANTKLYMQREEGFIGTSLKKEEFVCDCSDLDQIIVFRKDGYMLVTRVSEKTFVGRQILYAGVFHKDEKTIYHMIYTDLDSGITYAKRFQVGGITLNKEYALGKSTRTRVHYFSANPNGETEIVQITLSPSCSARKKVFEFNFADLDVKNRQAQGNQVTRYPIKTVKIKEKSAGIIQAEQRWYDPEIGRLNTEGKGQLLGNFYPDDKILIIYKNGTYELNDIALTHRYDPHTVMLIEKFDPAKTITAIYYDGEKDACFAKRFHIETQSEDTVFSFIREHPNSVLLLATTDPSPIASMITGKRRSEARQQRIQLASAIAVTGWKAVGTKICEGKPAEIHWEKQDDTGIKEQASLF